MFLCEHKGTDFLADRILKGAKLNFNQTKNIKIMGKELIEEKTDFNSPLESEPEQEEEKEIPIDDENNKRSLSIAELLALI